ncbi:MAG: flavin reductase family protein [Bacillota bacterium]|nr:flavin reductase family protein [Bacillota bacterium]
MQKVKINNYPMVNPAPVVIAGAEVDGKPNYATIGAFGVVCLAPVFYISLKETHFTTQGIRENGYFSVNIPTADMVRITDYCGMVSGKTTDKANLFNSFYDDAGKAPMISEAPMNFLCKVIQTVPISGFEVFFGEIVLTYIDDNCLTDGRPDPAKINPMVLVGPNYFNIGQLIGNAFKEGVKFKQV